MTISDRIYLYNQWFDRLPQQQQFLAAFWSALGTLGVMLMLTWFAGIPFTLMVLLFLLVVMGPRVMFKFDMIGHAPELPARDVGGETHIAVEAPAWVYRLNHWFDAQPDHMRILAVAAATVGIFVANLILYALIGFPVGLLVVLAVLVLGWARVVHVQGWLAPEGASDLSLHPGRPILTDTAGPRIETATPAEMSR
ncbi:hypothetical protein ACFQS7_11225 [Dankookia sp. GCM10030260]|uniref:hypothetical protein n=1 Tax=Dankookia sp. GCM10030260 TaxID=3273390 RepID=UPI003609A7EE